MSLLRKFYSSECGAITVDWTVMTAAVLGLGIASATAVATGTGSLGQSIQAALTNASVAGARLAALDFDDVDGLAVTGWGWRTWSSYGGWDAVGSQQSFEIVHTGHRGVVSPDGRNMLDMDASPGNLAIGRVLDNLTSGGTHTVTLNVADSIGNNGVDVYFGGELVGQVDPGRSMSSYSFDFVGGSGDGSNELVLQGTGPADAVGAYIHGVEVY